MTLKTLLGSISAVIAGCALAAPAAAVIVSEGDPGGPFSGIPYAFQITLETDSDGATVADFVGGKSWAHPMNPGLGSFGLDAGWTHTSNWMYLILEEERTLRFELSPNEEVEDGFGGFWSGELVPAFTLWSGVDDEGVDEHFYTQGAVPGFVDAPGFAYMNSVDMGPGPYDGSSATLEVTLAAGEYTIAVGDHDETALTEQNRGYSFCVANAAEPCPPVFVPEPALALQLLTGAGVLLGAIRLRSRRA